ncbi:MAG: tyrosine--tRNA ligase [Candidatus Brennerbacteria bacterium]
MDALNNLLTRSVDTIYPSREAFEKALSSGKKLTVYLGVDPTGPHLHLGHATNLLVLRRFQALGHKVILLIGDFTARIGDPTDKLAARKPLTASEVKQNLKTFKKQAAKIINFSGTNAAKLAFNSKWHAKMTFEKLIELASHFTEQQMVERDMFQERKRNDKPIGLHEFLYPLMQGYDSVALDVDVEIGGTDQTFNMLAGRKLLREYKNKEKFVVTTKLLENPRTGKKLMNKSEGGLISLDDKPNDMFGKLMALPDEGIRPVAEFCTEMAIEDIEKMMERDGNPRDAKLSLAYEVVKLYHNQKAAAKAREEWIRTFSKKETPNNVDTVKVKQGATLLEAVRAAGVGSNSEAVRLFSQSAIKRNGETARDPKIEIRDGDILKIGKKKFVKVRIS